MNCLDLNSLIYREARLTEIPKLLLSYTGGLRGYRISNTKEIKPPATGSVIIGWRENEEHQAIPALIITPEGGKMHFFAFSLTTMSEIAPITSMTRVIDWNELWSLQQLSSRKSCANSCLLAALVLGEVAAELPDSSQLAKLNFSAIETACSYTLAQYVSARGTWHYLVSALEKWEYSRRLLGAPSRKISLEEIYRIWRIVGEYSEATKSQSSSGIDFLLIDTLHAIGEKQPFLHYIEQLIGPHANVNALEIHSRATIEERVVTLGRFAAEVSGSQIEPIIGGFLVGVACALLSPGETRHAELARRWGAKFDTTVVWYFIISSIQEKASTRFLWERNGIGLQCVSRLTSQTEKFEPDCDVSLDELEVMKRNEGREFPIRQRYGSIIRVEIEPFVIASIRRTSVNKIQMDLFEDKLQEVKSNELNETVSALRRDMEKLEILLGFKDSKRRKRA